MMSVVGVAVIALTFDEYQIVFDRHYPTTEAAENKRQTFEANVAEIERCNDRAAAGLQGWQCGVNALSDLNASEFRALLGFRPSAAAMVRRPQFNAPAGVVSPAAVDWRTKGAVTPIKDQGSCG